MAALVHDLLVTVGVYSISGFEVTPATVIAILTILGYSIYDGIVVFDKVDENTRLVSLGNRMTYSDMVNLSLNQVLMRSLNTSITACSRSSSLLVVGSFVLGASTLQEFALALFIGLVSGAYSSIFIASPLLAWLKEREPRYRDVRRRQARPRGAKTSVADDRRGRTAVAASDDELAADDRGRSGARSGGDHPSRPRRARPPATVIPPRPARGRARRR